MEYLIAKTFNHLTGAKDKRLPYARTVGSPVSSKVTGRTVTGYASVFGSPDTIDDIVVPGAFKKSIALFNDGRSRCRFLWNHNSDDPPIAQILELKEVTRDEMPAQYRSLIDVTGALQVTRKYFEDDYSERIFQGVVSKAIMEMSFQYQLIKYSFVERAGRKFRLLEEIELFDCADVNWGCHPDTSSMIKGPQVRNAAKAAADKEWERLRRSGRDFIADTNFRLNAGDSDANWIWQQAAKKDVERLLPAINQSAKSQLAEIDMFLAFGK